MARTVTYLGKPGKPDSESLPVTPFNGPFEVNKPRAFGADDYKGLGFAKASDGDAFVDQLFTQFNSNRGDLPLFKVEKIGATAASSGATGGDAGGATDTDGTQADGDLAAAQSGSGS